MNSISTLEMENLQNELKQNVRHKTSPAQNISDYKMFSAQNVSDHYKLNVSWRPMQKKKFY